MDATSQPYFDPMRYALRWFDEEPEKLGGDSYENFLDLLIVRSFIHRGKDRADWWIISPTTYFAEVWDEALAKAPNWPGFNRLSLSAVDCAYFEQQLARPADDFF